MPETDDKTAVVLDSLGSYLEKYERNPETITELVRRIQGFSSRVAQVVCEPCYIGLLTAIGSARVLRIWLFLSWRGLNLDSTASFNTLAMVEDLFYRMVCQELPKDNLTLHLEQVDNTTSDSIDEQLRNLRREEDCVFHGSFTTKPTN